ncbi:MAG: response regulator [Parafilimonas sp.]
MKIDPIVIIDDDEDDRDLFNMAFDALNVPNKIIIFSDSTDALEFLKKTDEQIFFIICDINMPKLNGLELRQKINENESLRLKAIPFLFLSTSGDDQVVNTAFGLNIQGFFKKPSNIEHLKIILGSIITYWSNF